MFEDLLPVQVIATTTTDGGHELSASHDVSQIANSYAYEVTTTALDASS